MRKNIWLFIIICIPLSNILWFTGYSILAREQDNPTAMSVIMLASFLPALTALVLSKVNKEGWESLMLLPNLRKSWKVYIFAMIFTWIMIYLNDIVMLLFFRENVAYSAETLTIGKITLNGWAQAILLSLLAIPASIEMLGEELGWMGFLFPKLEKLHGTNLAILFIAGIRTIWHLGILVFFPHPVIGACDLFLSNLFSQSFLVYVTKKSRSLFPAGLIHALTNLLPQFIVYSNEFYNDNILAMNATGLISAFVVGVFCYTRMYKENMIQ